MVRVLHVRFFPLPEEVGEVVFIKSDGEVPDLLTDTAVDVLGFWEYAERR